MCAHIVSQILSESDGQSHGIQVERITTIAGNT